MSRYIIQIKVCGQAWEDFAYPNADKAIEMFNHFKKLEEEVKNKSRYRLVKQEVITES